MDTSRRERGRFCNIFLEQSLVWKYCLKLEGCLHNFFLIGPHSDAAEPNSVPKIVTQFLEPSLVLLRRFCLNVRILRMPFNPRNHRCRYSPHSWSLVPRRGPLRDFENLLYCYRWIVCSTTSNFTPWEHSRCCLGPAVQLNTATDNNPCIVSWARISRVSLFLQYSEEASKRAYL